MSNDILHIFRYSVFMEDGVFVARCLNVEMASEGDTREEAVSNLQEALELYFEHEYPPSVMQGESL